VVTYSFASFTDGAAFPSRFLFEILPGGVFSGRSFLLGTFLDTVLREFADFFKLYSIGINTASDVESRFSPWACLSP